jgi:hypothetical protein
MDEETKKTKKEDPIINVGKAQVTLKIEEITPPITTEELIISPQQQPQAQAKQIESLNNMDERKMFADGLEFDEEIDLSDDISFDPPNKSGSTTDEKKYTFF